MTEQVNRVPRIERLTSSIREMASRVNAEFVPDSKKSQTYGAASDQVYQMMAARSAGQQE
jgi:hypothetical protein